MEGLSNIVVKLALVAHFAKKQILTITRVTQPGSTKDKYSYYIQNLATTKGSIKIETLLDCECPRHGMKKQPFQCAKAAVYAIAGPSGHKQRNGEGTK
jgi:hypothetical protein